jgi:hypothetical protein
LDGTSGRVAVARRVTAVDQLGTCGRTFAAALGFTGSDAARACRAVAAK